MEKGTESDKLNPEQVSTPDDEEEMIGKRPCNSFENASCMSKLFFTWPQKLLQEGLIKPIEEKDLPGKRALYELDQPITARTLTC